MSRQWRSDDTDKWKYGFGSGKDGSTYAVPANAGCSGTSGGTSLTLDAASSFANGDLVMIHQSKGTGAGNWELNKIASGGGTTSIVLEHDLQNTYTDSGNDQAQIIELKEYKNLTVSTTVTVPAWDGNKGGIIAFLDKGTTTISGTLNASGGNGATASSGTAAGGSGGGFRGGLGRFGHNTQSQQGEGTGGGLSYATSSAGSGGGGGFSGGGDSRVGKGGGGGNATNGSSGESSGSGSSGGSGGSSTGNTELTNITFGGGGGGTNRGKTQPSEIGGGGAGGGIVLIVSNKIIVSGSISVDGGRGSNPSDVAWNLGGAGAGGSVLLKCVTADLGSNKLSASAGSNAGRGSPGGASGSVGRIHIDYSGSYTGTTTPTLNARLDPTIKPAVSGGMFLAFC